ncbi:MAG: segregation/condensation protein A [Bacillota bacterium]|nr:segregation/condensation protein A [Bacillota bacterium]
MEGREDREGRREGQSRPEIRAGSFSGPLDLLLHLIERDRIDIHDIPIARITDQYLEILDRDTELDMELASEFLVMAATLLEIKSRLLLPGRREEGEEGERDPREDLVLRLLAYRRARLLAAVLKERHERYRGCRLRLPSTAKALGIQLVDAEPSQPRLSVERFERAARTLAARNQIRYASLRERLEQVLRRDRVSLVGAIRSLWLRLRQQVRLLFDEIWPRRTNRTERITGFLAVLELLRLNRIQAEQNVALGPICLSADPGASLELDDLDGLEGAYDSVFDASGAVPGAAPGAAGKQSAGVSDGVSAGVKEDAGDVG